MIPSLSLEELVGITRRAHEKSNDQKGVRLSTELRDKFEETWKLFGFENFGRGVEIALAFFINRHIDEITNNGTRPIIVNEIAPSPVVDAALDVAVAKDIAYLKKCVAHFAEVDGVVGKRYWSNEIEKTMKTAVKVAKKTGNEELIKQIKIAKQAVIDFYAESC